jgi:mono/diheme cytochrome c family protein
MNTDIIYKTSVVRKNLLLVLWVFMMFALISCDRDDNSPGYIFYPDMAYSRSYETYSPNPVFENGYTMRDPAEGTIPRDVIPYPYEKNDEDRAIAAKNLVNPIDLNTEVLERGKKMFEVYCQICHGPQGDGKGYLFTSGKYPFPPASLLSDKMLQAPGGDIFHVITVGHGIMAAHGTMVQPEDRWKISMYVKEVLQK